jgi:hypothetical protein
VAEEPRSWVSARTFRWLELARASREVVFTNRSIVRSVNRSVGTTHRAGLLAWPKIGRSSHLNAPVRGGDLKGGWRIRRRRYALLCVSAISGWVGCSSVGCFAGGW